jgi:flavin-dependent dehydrogenase
MAGALTEVDVAVIGGGPAGSAAALTLLRYTKRAVALIERSTFEQPRAGESTSPAIVPLLHFLGVAEVLSARTARAAPAYAAAWGGPEPMVRHGIFTGQGDGLLLDRRAFDRALGRAVAERGGRLLLGHGLRRARREGPGWHLEIEGPAGPASLRCGFVIDASGRGASFARGLGVQRRDEDALVGVVVRFAPRGREGAEDEEPAATLVEAAPDGWWYSAPLPDGQLVAAYMTDAVSVRAARLATVEGLQATLRQAPFTLARVLGREASAAPHVARARSQRLERFTGEGWAAAGDAATAFDPLSSMGIGYALWSGTHAARLAEDVLLGGSPLAEAYDETMGRHFEQYLRLRWRYYQLERRWADRPFWAARHARPPELVGAEPGHLAGRPAS